MASTYDVMSDTSEETHSSGGIKVLKNQVDCSLQKTGGVDDGESIDVMDMADYAGWTLVGLMGRVITPDAEAIGIDYMLGAVVVHNDQPANDAAKVVHGGMLAAGLYIDGTAQIILMPNAGDSNLTTKVEVIAILVK